MGNFSSPLSPTCHGSPLYTSVLLTASVVRKFLQHWNCLSCCQFWLFRNWCHIMVLRNPWCHEFKANSVCNLACHCLLVQFFCRLQLCAAKSCVKIITLQNAWKENTLHLCWSWSNENHCVKRNQSNDLEGDKFLTSIQIEVQLSRWWSINIRQRRHSNAHIWK